jgi:2-oxoacid:acceptor oxidoreductase gamma subunit (pyruvate/2-ketoisovalerate family)
MIEIRFHGRGGLGAVFAGYILASAAFIEKKDIQAFPFFGVERRGAPVTAYVRINSKPIKIRSQIYTPDYVIVLDEMLLNQVKGAILEGVSENCIILVNTPKKPSELKIASKTATVDATQIAIKHGLGTKAMPIVNTPILGAFANVSKIVSLSSLITAIREKVPAKVTENIEAAREAYEMVNF